MIDKKNFEKDYQGLPVSLKTIKNKNGTRLDITNYGARIVSWIYNGVDIVVGYETLDEYLESSEYYYGATIGRFANRIKEGKFSLAGKDYELEVNNEPNHLHGGTNGFHNKVWEFKNTSDQNLILHHNSPDGDEGYPGNLQITLSYTLNNDDELIIEYKATTDATTIINVTNHSFFNLNGQGTGDILNHSIQINADQFTLIDKNLIPTGELAPVEGTPFDFRKEKKIESCIHSVDKQLEFGLGYDHNFALNKLEPFSLAARAVGDKTEIVLETFTDQPGMQFYSGNFMKSKHNIKYGLKDDYRSAFCFETQHFPDSPNQDHFPSTILNRGETFESKTIYKLSLL